MGVVGRCRQLLMMLQKPYNIKKVIAKFEEVKLFHSYEHQKERLILYYFLFY